MTVDLWTKDSRWFGPKITYIPSWAETAPTLYLSPSWKRIYFNLDFKDTIDGNIKISFVLSKKGTKNKFSNGKKKCIFDPKIHQKYLDRSIEFVEGLRNEKFKVKQNGIQLFR